MVANQLPKYKRRTSDPVGVKEADKFKIVRSLTSQFQDVLFSAVESIRLLVQLLALKDFQAELGHLALTRPFSELSVTILMTNSNQIFLTLTQLTSLSLIRGTQCQRDECSPLLAILSALYRLVVHSVTAHRLFSLRLA